MDSAGIIGEFYKGWNKATSTSNSGRPLSLQNTNKKAFLKGFKIKQELKFLTTQRAGITK